MWFVYRLPGRFTGWAFSTPLSDYLASLGSPNEDGEIEYTPASECLVRKTNAALDLARVTAKQVGWDGTTRGQPHVFPVPTFSSLVRGFIWMQETLGQTFMASPVDLVHLHNDIDWDARTDSEALSRVKAALTGEEKTKRRETPWITSQNGNPTRTIGGHRFTVFKNKRGGFGVVVSDPLDKKCFGKDCPTQKEAMDYADDNAETLKKACK